MRQAIVVIHGMGEQRPGDTLRQMVDAIIPERAGMPRYISRPDKVTDGPDSRRLLAFGGPEMPQTEVYEYHWAHLMPGNKITHLVPLLKKLLLRLPWHVPGRLAVFYYVLWGLIWLGLAGLWWLYAAADVDDFGFEFVLAAVGVTGVYLFVATQVFKLITRWLTSSFVDVARYVDAAPTNQQARDEIREGAVDLLAGLHETGRYSRIIVVAHSLGSFIGYDAIHYLWARMNQAHNDAYTVTQALDAYEAGAASPDGGYQDLQRNLWAERRSNGNPWVITDLVSLGSPMTHAELLLARNSKDLQRRKTATELPTNPPVAEIKPPDAHGVAAPYSVSYPEEPPKIIYHGAPFAVVRWTNIWFGTDLFGGPIQPTFGPGVRDVKAAPHGFKQHVPLWSHSGYFERDKTATEEPDGSVAHLRKAADLNDAASWVPDQKQCPKPNRKVWPPVTTFQVNVEGSTAKLGDS